MQLNINGFIALLYRIDLAQFFLSVEGKVKTCSKTVEYVQARTKNEKNVQ